MGVVIELPKDREERKLKKVKIGLMRNPKFVHLGGVMMSGTTKIADDVSTAYTNGRDEVYGRGMLKWMNEKEAAFVVLHEVMHKAKRDLITWRALSKIDHELTNMACDYVNNLMLVNADPDEQFISMPRRNGEMVGLLDRRFQGMNVKQVFDILKQEEQDGKDIGRDNPYPMDFHDWEGAENMSDEEKEALTKEIDRALRQGQIAASKLAGRGSGDLDRAIEEILKPKVDWKEVMREFVSAVCNNKDTSSWRKPNRRYLSMDIYMPSLTGETVGRILVAVDTSGSIQGKALSRFLSEVKALADDVKPEAIDLLYWGSSVVGHEVYESNNISSLVDSTKPRGGGGTEASCVPAYMKEKKLKPECVVVLTDGYVGDWGTWDVPVLWVVVGSTNVAPVGKTINVEEIE